MWPQSVRQRFSRTDELLTRMKAPAEALRLLEMARKDAPVSDPSNVGRSNTLIECIPKKSADRVVVLESMSLIDLARAWYEFDGNVIEFHYRPVENDMLGYDERGILRSRTPHVFSFLVMYANDGLRLEDWRNNSFFSKLRESSTGRYEEVPTGSGKWFDRFAERFARENGVAYLLRSNADLPDKLVDNRRFLADYEALNAPQLSAETRCRMQEAIQGESKSLRQLRDLGFTSDEVYKGIVEGVVYVDLERELLRESENLLFHINAARAQLHRLERKSAMAQYPVPLPPVHGVRIGDEVPYQGAIWTVEDLTSEEGRIVRDDSRSTVLPILELAERVKQHLQATGRAEEIRERAKKTLNELPTAALEDALARRDAALGLGTRQYSGRHNQRLREKMGSTTDPLVQAVLLQDQRRTGSGNRTFRYAHPIIVEKAIAAIKKYVNTPTCRKGSYAYDQYLIEMERYNNEERKGLKPFKPMGKTAFNALVNIHRDTLKRGGERRAYNEADIPLRLDVRFPLHGARPREVLYIDNTLLPVMTAGPRGEHWGKIWLCAAIDGHTGKPVAAFLTYEHPSAKTALLLMRIYIQREKRVPRVIVVDGGSDFRSGGFKTFCRVYGIDMRQRPGKRPRDGTKIENMFAVMDRQFISALEGNSRQLKDGARLTTPDVDPVRNRVWTFTELNRAIENYLYTERPSHIHPHGGGLTIEAYDRKRIEETGEREHMEWKLNADIMLLTSPFPKNQEHKVQKKGVYLDDEYYWDPLLAPLVKKKLKVRREPWYAGVIYVETPDDGWIVLKSHNPELWVRTSYEVHMARQALAAEARRIRKRDRVSPQRAKSMVAATNRLTFEDSIFMKEHVERLYAFLDRDFRTAMPLPREILDAVDNYIDCKGIFRDLASMPSYVAQNTAFKAENPDAGDNTQSPMKPVERGNTEVPAPAPPRTRWKRDVPWDEEDDRPNSRDGYQ
ncbi:Mu transposase C-terminal domain-containing protein [Paraburkholderia caribensis]|uniref:Mu transposase C-terminal domain-containing protein n=1 Tax=Paraburkholderia caribensis TaxID=75105 RepID=UPI001591F9A1|nr:DDE-type integrase/transposase/recombinase [Paraburkholderia caribensis]